MTQIIECVPNFSEGRDTNVINAIAEAIRNTSGVNLLDVDPGKSTNRTVYTFVGDKKSVVEAALAASRVALKMIDMTKQTGEHPRMGALDVCPFIPIRNATMQDCIDCSLDFAKRVSEELKIPIYLYEESQSETYRKRLPDIRQGEYEAFSTKIYKPEWKPDFGPQEFIPSWGATVTGARKFLIAYNVNVLGTNNQAHRIALNLREAGRSEQEPGALKEVKAIGWQVDEYNMAQVSMNLNDYNVTPPHIAYESCLAEAKKLNVGIAGSELVGLIPLDAIISAAEYYIKAENLFIVDEKQKVRLAVERLGLNSITSFIPEKRIIEYLIQEPLNEPLANLSVRQFVEAVAARTAAPGGGSVAATIASLGVGLGTMVAWLTYGVRKFEHLDSELRQIIPNLEATTQKLIPMIDADTNAFNDYLDAVRLPKETKEQIEIRDIALQNGLKKAIETPLNVMKIGNSIWNEMIDVAKYGNIASKSDTLVGARALELGIWGAYQNVMINMQQITDEIYKQETLTFAETLATNAKNKSEEIIGILSKRNS
ncbi:MAG: glutamate formimidoyltransferase [Candidatus Kapabacteria bacterium]|nr:glutamate formimidoyltransferase [Candidatus Kapabacteria bacterium]